MAEQAPPAAAAAARLRSDGCHLTPEGIETVGLGGDVSDLKNILKKVLDFDLREIGAPAFPEEFCKSGSKAEIIEEPIFLQIQKVRNISAPKANEESKHSPRMLKLILTDGHLTFQAIEVEYIPGLSINTPPGTKIQLKSGTINNCHGFLFLGPNSIKVLGGQVSHMIEKWELNRSLAKHTRVCVGGDGAPPPWIPFGQQLGGRDLQDEMLKVLQDQVKLCNAEFEAQRKGAIAEAQKLSGTKKIFGGGTKPMLDANVQKIVDAGFTEEQAENTLKITKYNADRALKILQRGANDGKKERPNKQPGEPGKGRKSRNKEATDEDGVGPLKPTGKLSLFDFLEDKLPVSAEPEKPVKRYEPVQHKEENKFEKNNHERKTAGTSNNNNNNNKSAGRGGRTNTNRQPPSNQPGPNNKYEMNQTQNNSYWQNDGQRNFREERTQHSYNSQQIINEKPPRFQRKHEGEVKKQQNMNIGQDTSYPPNYQSQMQPNYFNRRSVPDNRQRGYYNQQPIESLANATSAMSLDSQAQNRYNMQNTAQNYQNNFAYPGKPNYNQNYQNESYKRTNQYQNNKPQNQMPSLSNGQSINQSFYGQYSDNQMKANQNNIDQTNMMNVLHQQQSQQQQQQQQEQQNQQQQQQHDLRNNFNFRGFYRAANIVGFQNATINEQARKMLAEGTEINWNIGDRCVAKYWEDNTYYDAEITGVSARTVVVRFLVYGNHEEILRSDCLLPNHNNQAYGRDGPVNRGDNSRPGRFHQPMYVPPAQRKA